MLILDLRFIGSRIFCRYGGLGLQSLPAIQGLCAALDLLAARLPVSRCAAPPVPGQEVAAPPPRAPAFPAAVLVGECGGSQYPDRGGTGGNISRFAPEPLRLKGPMGEAATRAASLQANSQHLCHSKSGCKLSQIQPTTQSPQNPRALRIHLPAEPETPDKPSVYTAIF